LFDQLDRHYGLLRQVLDRYLLPDFRIEPSHVIVAVYPPALENENGAFYPQSNIGLTVATFGSFWTDARDGEGTLFGPFGVTPGVVGDPESMHVPRTAEVGQSCLANNVDISDFHPFPARPL